MKELKECPFCGGKALYREVSEDWYRIIVDHKKGCLLNDSALNYSQTLNDMVQLTKDWNTRSSVSVSELQVLMHQTNQVWSWVGEEDALKHITEDLQALIDKAKHG